MSGTNEMWQDPHSTGQAVAVFDRADNFVGIKGKKGEVISLSAAAKAAQDYTIGAFYFPGWSTPGGGPNAAAPWAVIPENRIPLIGAFDETLQEVADYNLTLAKDYGIKFFAYDWYADIVGGAYVPMLAHAINNHQSSTVTDKPRFCVNFCIQTNAEKFNPTTWGAIYRVWVDQYFSDANYQTFDGKPLVMIFDAATFQGCMGGNTAGVDAALDEARAYAVSRGFAGIHFVGLQSDTTNYWMTQCEAASWDGISSYTVFFKYENYGDTPGAAPLNYAALDDAIYGPNVDSVHSWWGNSGYANPPAWPSPALSSLGWPGRSIASFIAPIAAGYDERPWNSDSQLAGIPTDAQFEAHLIKARSAIDAYRDKTHGFGIITAWNEFGEGQYLVPTKANGFGRLQAVRRVFG